MPVVLSSKRFSFICRDFSSFFSFDFTTSTTKNPCHCVTKDARLFFGLKGSALNPEKNTKEIAPKLDRTSTVEPCETDSASCADRQMASGSYCTYVRASDFGFWQPVINSISDRSSSTDSRSYFFRLQQSETKEGKLGRQVFGISVFCCSKLPTDIGDDQTSLMCTRK